MEIFPNPSKEQSVRKDCCTTDESVVVVCGDRKGSLHLFYPKHAVASSQKASFCVYFKDLSNLFSLLEYNEN